jgi:serine beta-lactamase-like protein LACTB
MFARIGLACLAWSLAGLWPAPCTGDDKSPKAPLAPARAEAVDKAVRTEVERQKLVGVAVGVVENGRVVYAKGYGFADAEKRTPVTPATVFNWASNSKPLAAILAVQLAEKGQLDLDADVRKYVPEFPDKKVKITARHLLSHQSGIPHYDNGKVVPTDRKYAVRDPFADPVLALDKFNQSPLLFDPGEKASYSSYAYILLSAVVQRAGKRPFAEQVQTRVVKPLGLKSFQLDTSAAKPDWATGYVKKEDKVVRSDAAHYWKHGAGAFKSDVRDFARWAEGLINRELVSEATEKAMWEPQTLAGGQASTWGLGFGVGKGERLRVSHNGKQPEATTRLVIYPKERLGIVVMCNCEFADVGKLSSAVESALTP